MMPLRKCHLACGLITSDVPQLQESENIIFVDNGDHPAFFLRKLGRFQSRMKLFQLKLAIDGTKLVKLDETL
jgi:hypothetical protein